MTDFMYKISLKYLVVTQKGVKPIILRDHPFENSTPYLDINALESGVINQFTDKNIIDLTSDNDVLVVWDGSRSGLAFIGQEGAIGSTLMCLKPVNVLPDYLFLFLKAQFKFINGNTSGIGIPHVNSELFFEIEMPYISIERQTVIVNNIKNTYKSNSILLSQQKALLKKFLDDTDINFKYDVDDMFKSIQNFRQVVIQKALNGELTRNWRLENNVEEPRNTVKAKDICSLITKGSTPKSFTNDKNDVPFLKVYNLVNDSIDFEYRSQYVLYSVHNTILKRSKVYPNDVLLNIVGPPLGKVAIVKNSYPELNINQAIAVFRVKDVVLPEFLYYVLLEGTPIRDILPETKGDAGQSNISLAQCGNFTFLLPTIEEQNEIIKKIKTFLDIADKVQNQYKLSVEYFDQLDNAMLQDTFDNIDDGGEEVEALDNIMNQLLNRKKEIEERQVQDKIKRQNFINKNFMNANEHDKIKSKIKEIALDRYSYDQIITVDEISSLSKEIIVMIKKDFEYDDFFNLFLELAQDRINPLEDEPFFMAIKNGNKLCYKISKQEPTQDEAARN